MDTPPSLFPGRNGDVPIERTIREMIPSDKGQNLREASVRGIGIMLFSSCCSIQGKKLLHIGQKTYPTTTPPSTIFIIARLSLLTGRHLLLCHL